MNQVLLRASSFLKRLKEEQYGKLEHSVIEEIDALIILLEKEALQQSAENRRNLKNRFFVLVGLVLKFLPEIQAFLDHWHE